VSEEETVRFLASQVKQLPLSWEEKVLTLKKLCEDYGITWKEEYIDYLR
jgi:hypothetical protein